MKTGSRLITLALVGLALALLTGRPAYADGQVVVASWGGTYQDAQRKAFFEPFEKETGIKVVEATQPYGAKIKAMVESGNVEWDVAELVASDLFLLQKQGLLEKIDYAKFDKETLDGMEKSVLLPNGVGTVTHARVIAWSTKSYPSGKPHPESFADVWDVQRFPGKRVLDAGDYVVPPIEQALLADGVAVDQLYPIDFDRAYKSLARIRPAVIKWSKAANTAPQALIDGEADIAVAVYGRLLELKEQGAPVDFTLNQALVKIDYWAIPKGAKNFENAMKFIVFASRAKPFAALCMMQPYGPANHDAFKYIDEKRAPQLPTYPDNLKKEIFINDAWWAENDPKSGKSWQAVNLDLWSKWASAQ